MDPTYNFFLLLSKLSQLHDRQKIIHLFIEGLEEIFPVSRITFHPEIKENDDLRFAFRTMRSSFGSIAFEPSANFSEETVVLLRNTTQMVAVILERLDFELQLEKDRNTYELLAASRFAELTKTINELEEARSASINLVEDLSNEIEKRKKIEEEILLLNQTLEDRVKDRTEQLEESMGEIEAFSYSVSHDLRTPLRALNGFASILIEDYSSSLDSEGKRMLSVIRNNANRMGQLIDDLLEFSRLNRGEINYYRINMEKMAHEVFEELAPVNKKEQIVFSVQPLPYAWGDTSMIRQVWHNLIGNAIKFTSNKKSPSIEIGFIEENHPPCFFIKDNGVGFDPNFQAKLFGVFQRLHGITEFEGTGVGLAIVQRIIHRHNGRVWAEGKVGEGAVFYFTLAG